MLNWNFQAPVPRHFRVEVILSPGLKVLGKYLEQHKWAEIIEAPDAETARRIAVEGVKRAQKLWRGTATIYEPREVIEPVTPPVLPRPWLRPGVAARPF